MNPHQPSQLLTNLGLAALAGFAALAGLFRLSGTITAFLTGTPLPEYTGPKCKRLWLGRGYGNFCGGEAEASN